jgi:hypothetical protein
LWRVSKLSIDWVNKGFHLHYGNVEIRMRPTHDRRIVFKKVFASTSDSRADPVIQLAYELLEDKAWRQRMRRELIRASEYCRGVVGEPRQLAHLRIFHFKLLLAALDRMEAADGDIR